MKRPLAACAIALLVAAAAYSLLVAIRASLTAEGYDPAIFWTAIGIFFVFSAGALWLASRLYRQHFSRGRPSGV
jgi:ABC-type Na+ efflux pump permease subunit